MKPQKVPQAYATPGIVPVNSSIIIDPKVAYLPILHLLCNMYKVNLNDLLSKNRHKDFVYARQLYCYLMRDIFHDRATVVWLGENLNRDYTTIIHSITTFKDRIDTDESISKDYMITKNKIILWIYKEQTL